MSCCASFDLSLSGILLSSGVFASGEKHTFGARYLSCAAVHQSLSPVVSQAAFQVFLRPLSPSRSQIHIRALGKR